MCLWKLLLFPSWRNQQFLVCWSLEVGAHKDSGWDPRPQELTKRRGVLEESGGRPRRPEESGGRPRSPLESGGHLEESGGREQRPSSESVCGVRVEEWGGRPRSPSAESVWRSEEAVRGVRLRSPSGGARRLSAESAGALGRHSCGEGRAVTTSISWGEARDVARCPVMPRVRNPGPGENQGDQEADGTQKWLCPWPLLLPHLSAVGCVLIPSPRSSRVERAVFCPYL